MLYVGLPAYNEEAALPPLIERLIALRDGGMRDLVLFVVDDGSADGTAAVVAGYGEAHPWIRLVPHERNKGLSQAIQTIIRTFTTWGKPGDTLVTLDADNTQPPETIPAMLSRLGEGYDVVIASRFRPGAKVYGVPPLRRLYSRVMSVLFQAVMPVKGVRDYSCGFRAYRYETLRAAVDAYGDSFITEQGFSCMVEILLQLNHLPGVRFSEVPFTLHYDWKPTATKMRVGKTISDTLRLAARHRFRRKPTEKAG